jgi:hypothetical protein
MACDCGASIARRVDEDDRPPSELDARGRRLRAALAAGVVPDNAPELRVMHEWLDTWHGIRAGATLTLAMQDL